MLLGGVASILAQVVVLKPLMDCVKEKGVIVVALLASILECAALIVSAFYPEKWLIFAVAAPSCIGELSFAAISSLKSVNVSEKVHYHVAANIAVHLDDSKLYDWPLCRSKAAFKVRSTARAPSSKRRVQSCTRGSTHR